MSGTATKPTILVLDDEKNIRRSLEIVLAQEGMHVLVAHDPAAAMRMLRERNVDVLLLDIKLGELDGITFYQTIQREGYATPTIFISGHATLTQAAQAVKLGGYDFIEKPFTAEKVVITVQRCLELTRLEARLHVAETQLEVTEQDIPLLIRCLAQRLCARNNLQSKPIDADVIAELQRYHWPGNVRELANVLERMLLLSAERVTMAYLPEEIAEVADTATDSNSSLLKSLRDKFERDFIINTLRKHGGNVSQTAQELGVRRTYLHRRIVVLNIAKKDFFG